MRYTKFGPTGMDVSVICLGCMSFGEPDLGNAAWSLPEAESRELIKQALDAGINFFDTANIYSAGSSEEITGRALKDFAKRFTIAATGPTFHARRPVGRLDRIMASPELRIADCGVHHSPASRTASDHLPIWAKVEPA